MVKVYPSILSADFSKLAEEIKEIEMCGADGIHIDVMDGHFVNNLTFGAPVVKDIRDVTQLFFDVHLMISNPEKYIEDFVKAGADRITIHTEAVDNVTEVVDMILAYGVKAGISIKPNTEVPQDINLLKKLDSILMEKIIIGQLIPKVRLVWKLNLPKDLIQLNTLLQVRKILMQLQLNQK